MEIHHLSVRRTARVAVLGGGGPDEPAETWTVLHGYRQAAPRFLRRFRALASSRRRVVAPEGLSRFYLEAPEGAPRRPGGLVGASWMTREDRETEIADYVAYLDAVARSFSGEGRHTLLGFSQGAHTAARWAALGEARVDRLVLWGAPLPQDLPAEGAKRLEGVGILLVRGAEDPLRNEAEEAREEAWLREGGCPYRVLSHPGGHEIDADLLAALAEAPR